MKTLTGLLVPVLLCVLCTAPGDAGEKKKKKKNAAQTGDVVGTVVAVTKGDNADSPAVLTVKVPGAKKKAPATERKFELAKGVKLETLTIAKKAFGLKTAKVEDIKEGERVLVQVKEGKNDQADRVLVVHAGKKPKAAAN